MPGTDQKITLDGYLYQTSIMQAMLLFKLIFGEKIFSPHVTHKNELTSSIKNIKHEIEQEDIPFAFIISTNATEIDTNTGHFSLHIINNSGKTIETNDTRGEPITIEPHKNKEIAIKADGRCGDWCIKSVFDFLKQQSATRQDHTEIDQEKIQLISSLYQNMPPSDNLHNLRQTTIKIIEIAENGVTDDKDDAMLARLAAEQRTLNTTLPKKATEPEKNLITEYKLSLFQKYDSIKKTAEGYNEKNFKNITNYDHTTIDYDLNTSPKELDEKLAAKLQTQEIELISKEDRNKYIAKHTPTPRL